MARILHCTAAEYHRDPCPTPSLSSSIANTLLSKSPKHAWLHHPKLGGKQRLATREMDAGSLIHSLLLDAGKDIVAVDADDWRTKEARAKRDAFRARGKLPVLHKELAEAEKVVEILRDRIEGYGIELSGQSELAIEWSEQDDAGRPVLCRGMLDHVVIGNDGTIYDVKTSASAHPRACAKHVLDFGYDIQRAAYTSALTKLHPELTGRTDFVFLFCEIEEPFSVTPARLDGSFRALGQSRWDRAVQIWSSCMRTGQWPGYADGIVSLEAPPWALNQELGAA